MFNYCEFSPAVIPEVGTFIININIHYLQSLYCIDNIAAHYISLPPLHTRCLWSNRTTFLTSHCTHALSLVEHVVHIDHDRAN